MTETERAALDALVAWRKADPTREDSGRLDNPTGRGNFRTLQLLAKVWADRLIAEREATSGN